MNITILYGGISAEQKISIKTGLAVADAINKIYNLDMINFGNDLYKSPNFLMDTDLVFNALHGGEGENGTLQAFLDIHKIPYTGSNSKACKIAMDKNITKLLSNSLGINTPKWILLKKDIHLGAKLLNNKTKKFSYPFIVKPSNEGSTFGLSLVNNESELEKAIESAAVFSNEILIEEYIPGRELTVGILGNKPLPVVEIKPSSIIYDYNCKYKNGMSEYIVPADLASSIERSLTADAIKIYQAIGCRHYARVDFRMNEKGEHFLLEINTLPGMTSTSLLPMAAKEAGLDFFELIDTIVKLAKLDI